MTVGNTPVKRLSHSLPNLKLRLLMKLWISFMAVSVIGLGGFGYYVLDNTRQLGTEAFNISTSLGWSAISDAAVAFDALNKRLIRQKAQDVARQVDIYLQQNPNKSIRDLRGDLVFKGVAVQPVGTTGTTALVDGESGRFYLHAQRELVDTDAQALAEEFPAAWSILATTLNENKAAGGDYSWKDSDGNIRQMYMETALVERRTADSRALFVLAAVPVDEFSTPAGRTSPRIIEATFEANREIEERMNGIIDALALSLIAIFLAITGLSLYIARMITNPISILTRGAEAIGRGEFDHRVALQSGDEIEMLANSFNRMAADLKKHIQDLGIATAERERFLRELEIAKGIQQSFLPEVAPEIEGMVTAAFSAPAKEVGGDFYDFIQLPGGRWGFVIADVSGKGVPAALFMALSRTLVRATASRTASPSETVTQTNELICADSKSSMFVTLFYGVLDPVKRTFTYVNAGHNPPIVVKPSSGSLVSLETRGIALGVVSEASFDQREIALGGGDIVVFYTDGVTEAIAENGEEFGEARLVKAILDNRALPPEQLIRRIEEAVINFVGHQPEFDDITLMALKVA